MTPADFADRCQAAGLSVLGAARVGAQVVVLVQRKGVPTSAGGLQALAARIGVVGMAVGNGDGTGAVELRFAASP